MQDVKESELEEFLQKLLALPGAARAAIAGRLLESLDATVDEEVEAAWDAEIARRAKELDSGSVTPIPWSEARRAILRS